jgi:putative flippase GtrA
VGALLNGACVWGLGHWLGLHYLLAQMLATLMAMIFTYRLNRAWSFAA